MGRWVGHGVFFSRWIKPVQRNAVVLLQAGNAPLRMVWNQCYKLERRPLVNRIAFYTASQWFFLPRDVTGKEPTDVVSGGRNYSLSTMSAMFERYECSKPPSCGLRGCPSPFFLS